MSKIVIEIDGEDFSVTVDGKKIANLAGVELYGYIAEDIRYKDLNFRYSTRENNPDEDFAKLTTFYYAPASASFSSGQVTNDVRNKKIYKRM